MELEQFGAILESRDKIVEARKKKGLKIGNYEGKSRKIIGLSCGKKNGNSEFLLKEAAMGAAELGVETEIIRAMELRVKPCDGCDSCTMALSRGKIAGCSIKDDDVPWILEKTVVEDCGLIVSFPVYYLRANGYLMAINERMHATMFSHLETLNKRNRIGAIIGVGGSGSDWTTLGLFTANIWVQHHRTLVDQVQIGYSGRPGAVLANKESMARARELGRNVARAMIMPYEDVKFMGNDTAVSCPICHCNILQVPDDLPNVACPSCWVHGVISVDGGKMTVKWNEEDIKRHRWSEYGLYEHMNDLCERLPGATKKSEGELKELIKKYREYGKIIRPDSD